MFCGPHRFLDQRKWSNSSYLDRDQKTQKHPTHPCPTDTSVAVGPGNSVHAATRAIEHCTRPFANAVVARTVVALPVAANDVLGVNLSAVQILGERGGTRPCVPVTVIRLHRWRTLV